MDLKCRGCLSTEGIMKNFFEPSYQGLSLADMLETYTVIQVTKSDGLPSQICQICTTSITNLCHFIKMFQESEKQLITSIVGTSSITNQDSSHNSNDIVKLETSAVKSEEPEEDRTENCTFDMAYDTIFEQQCSNDVFKYTVDTRDSIKYSCHKCGDCFLFQIEFQEHMLQNHDTHVIDFQEYCSKITIKIPPVGIKETKNDLQCKDCQAVFENNSELNKHSKTHKNFVCEHCGLTFKRKSNLSDHVVIHSAERHYICNICGKSYRSRGALGVHKKAHLNLRNLVCEKCGKGFNSWSTLKVHIMLKHTNQKNFKCMICGTLFPLKSWLDKHMLRKHKEREKNHVCSICGMAYFEKFTLNRHISFKHSENVKKHSCDTCGKHYTTKTNLMKHFRNFHGLKSKNEGSENDNVIVNNE